MIEFTLLGGAQAFAYCALTFWVAFVGLGTTHVDIGPEKNRNTRITANPRTLLFTPEQTFAGRIDACIIGVLTLTGAVVILNVLASTGLFGFRWVIDLMSRCR